MTVRKKGNKWYCRFQIDGIRYERTCKGASTQKDAEKCETVIKSEIMHGNYNFGRTENKRKLKELIDLYLQYSKINKSSYESDVFSTNIFLDYIGNIAIDNITSSDLENFKEFLKTERNIKNATVNRYLHNLCRMFNLAIENKWMQINPFNSVKYLREDNHKIRFLSKEEEKRLFAEINKGKEVIGRDRKKKIIYPFKHIEPIIICALQTGMRRGEIFSLKWANIDKDFTYIELLKTKSGKVRKIPISAKLSEVLKSLPQINEFVFNNPDTKSPFIDIKKSFTSLLKAAKIENFRFHDLRHTVATRLVEKGVDLVVVQEIMGHSKIETTMRYAHPVPERKKHAISLLNSY